MPAVTPCPCGKPRSFAACCGRLLDDGQIAKTPEQLMRSRYSAYALGGYGDYLLETWFPATAGGLSTAQLSRREFDWHRLDVIARGQQGDSGSVEFKAWFTPIDSPADDWRVMHEISEFKRLRGRWYYVGRLLD